MALPKPFVVSLSNHERQRDIDEFRRTEVQELLCVAVPDVKKRSTSWDVEHLQVEGRTAP